VEFLLRVQALEERGFPVTCVEYVLGELQMDETAAAHFLPSFVQLIDLGFEQRRASDALLEAGGDRDKALDALLAAS
jgi:hypothetical protein